MKETIGSTTPTIPPPKPLSGREALRTFLWGGLLPIIVFTFVEEKYGTIWGLVAGMVFGAGELTFEWVRHRKFETITLVSNGMLLGLGGISLFTREGIWFKLQPAIMEVAMAGFLLITYFTGKPFLLMMARKQNATANLPPALVDAFEKHLSGFTVRLSVFLLAFAAVTSWASFFWSTRQWMFLKGIGFNVGIIAYAIIEMIWLRQKLRSQSTR